MGSLVNTWLQRLSSKPTRGYLSGQSPKAEPTAWSAIALASAGNHSAAERACQWLRSQQLPDGCVLAHEGMPNSGWPTSLAVLAWSLGSGHDEAIERGLSWIESAKGQSLPDEEGLFGHDTTLVAWSWIGETHSWIEPTSFHLMAMKAAGRGSSKRASAAVGLLRDRQLTKGGCNYGNTSVMGTTLRPHLQPSGIALAALRGESGVDSIVDRAESFLLQNLGDEKLVNSLCWAAIGLSAHGRRPGSIDDRLKKLELLEPLPHEEAMIALASLPAESSFYQRISTP